MKTKELDSIVEQVEYLQNETMSGGDLKSVVWDMLQEMENLTNIIMESGIDPTSMKDGMRSFTNSN